MDEPNYYSKNGLSPLQAFKDGLMSRDEYIGFLKGNVIKYIVRCGDKDDAYSDLHKAKDYVEHLMDVYLGYDKSKYKSTDDIVDEVLMNIIHMDIKMIRCWCVVRLILHKMMLRLIYCIGECNEY